MNKFRLNPVTIVFPEGLAGHLPQFSGGLRDVDLLDQFLESEVHYEQEARDSSDAVRRVRLQHGLFDG